MTSSSNYAARAAQRRRRMTIIVAGGILLAMIVAVSLAATSGLGNSKKPSGTKTANGLVQIANKADYAVVAGGNSGATGASSSNAQCRGTGNFTDISRGGTVTISDFNGTVLASTNLGQGMVDANGFCVFGFSAPVPVGRGPYGVQITRRKAVQVNEGDLFTLVTLTLGATG